MNGQLHLVPLDMYFTTKNKHAKTNRASVLIFGADPEGLGVAIVMKQAGIDDMLIIDIREIGASFLNWHRQMFLLTPSFHSNSFGLTDLNSIDPETSPADFSSCQRNGRDAPAQRIKRSLLGMKKKLK